MAIALKGMRKITVNGEVFLWKIRKKISHDEAHNDQYPIPIQHISGGQVLFVFVGFTRAYGGYYNESPESVTPKMIRPLIEKAIQLGWKYSEPGNAISLLNDTLEKDSKTAKWSADNFIIPE
jgi:hypothetical protein